MGNVTEVTAKRSKNDHAVTIAFDFGDTVSEAIEMFGEEVVLSKFKQSTIVDLQSAIRARMFEEDKESGDLTPVDSETVAASLAGWKPGVATRQGKSMKEKAKDLLSKMSPEEVKEMLASLEAGE